MKIKNYAFNNTPELLITSLEGPSFIEYNKIVDLDTVQFHIAI